MSSIKPSARKASGIRYEVRGRGPPVVLVHGLSGSSRWWKHNLDSLAEYFAVYTVNLIGFGSSRTSGQFVLEEAAARLCEWMTERGLVTAHLVGHSMGGLICAEIAARAPERVARLVLVNATIVPFSYGYIGHGLRMARVLPRVPLGFLMVLVTDTFRARPWSVLQAGRQLLAGKVHPRLDLIRAPTLAIWGARDHMVPKALGEQLVSAIKDAQLLVIKDAGHVPMWEQPDEFNRALIAFLRGESVEYRDAA